MRSDQLCVVIYDADNEAEPIAYGPFVGYTAAMRWASSKWGIGGSWYWLPLNAPN